MNGGEIIWSGEEKERRKGVGFYLSKRAKGALMEYQPVNSRIIAGRFRANPMNIAVIQICAPTADSTDEEIERFHQQLEDTMASIPKKDVKLIMGD